MGITLLTQLYATKPTDAFLLVWTLPDKKSHWFTDVAQAEAFCAGCVHQDVYFGLGLRAMSHGPYKRGKVADVTGIPGLWVDVDVQGEGHKKQNLPATQEEALAFFLEALTPTEPHALDLRPTTVVATGGGVHLYWRFPTMWVFDDDPGVRDRAKWLTDAWVRYLRTVCASQGWDLDGVADLTRVLRVPDTFNHKYTPPRQVETLHTSDATLSLEAITTYLEEWDRRNKATPTKGGKQNGVTPEQVEQIGAGLTVRPDATPHFEKWELLQEMEPRATDSWNHKGKSGVDTSPSAYDLSLATYAAMAGDTWTDQEVCDLLVAHRRKHREDLKRPDYYARTISKARASARATQAQEFLDEVPAMGEDELTPEERRVKILESLSELFGIRITRIIKYLSDPPQYRLETTQGALMLGAVQYLISHSNLRNAIAAATGVYIPSFKNRWEGIAQNLLTVCEEEEIGEEATDAGAVASWLTDYLDERKPVSDETEAFTQRSPLLRDGVAYLFMGDFQQWLSIHRMEKLSVKQLGAMFKVAGGSSEVVAFKRTDGTRTTRNLWRLPARWGGFPTPNDEKETQE